MATREQHNALLRTTYHFTIHDLDFNRTGQLSPGQEPPASEGGVVGPWLAWLGILITGGMTLLLLIVLVNGLRSGTPGTGGVCVGLLLFGIPFVMIAQSTFSASQNETRDARERRVATVSGLAQLTPADGGATLTIGGVSFWLAGDNARVFEPLGAYHVYYLPHSRKIVSAERADG